MGDEENEYQAPDEEEVGDDDGDVGDVGEEELSHQQKSDAADQLRQIRLHPEIWIPYKEQILAQLNVKAPIAAADVEVADLRMAPSFLRDLSRTDSDHTTYPFLTQYEKTKVTSFRASQLAHGAHPFILVPEGMTDSYEIARAELEEKKLPYIIKRPLPDGSYEVWKLADLVVFTTM